MKKTLHKIIHEDNFLSLAGNLTISLFGFAGFAMLARSFPVDIFGQWVLFMSSGTFIEMFRFGITNTAIIRFLAGAEPTDRLEFIGSNYLIGILATFIIGLVLILCNLSFPIPIQNAGYELFFTWYPILALINLPLNNALLILQADVKFGKILKIRLLSSGGFFVIVVVNYLFFDMTLMQLVWSMMIINALTSGICMLLGYDGIMHIGKATGKKNRTLLDFGKYTTFTLIGSSLLRSADTLIISLSPLGTAAVALYSIPMKLIELQQIPLRSFVATAFPKMSKASIHGTIQEVKDVFYKYTGSMTYLFLVMSLFTFVFADYLVLILGGKQYIGIDPATGIHTANIVRIFSVYGLFLPIDRMTGVGLDSINKPNMNFIKVFFMVTANVIGDIIAIFVFKSLLMVAVASILFIIVGTLVGYYYMNKQLSLDYHYIFTNGYDFYKSIYDKFRHRIVKIPN